MKAYHSVSPFASRCCAARLRAAVAPLRRAWCTYVQLLDLGHARLVLLKVFLVAARLSVDALLLELRLLLLLRGEPLCGFLRGLLVSEGFCGERLSHAAAAETDVRRGSSADTKSEHNKTLPSRRSSSSGTSR